MFTPAIVLAEIARKYIREGASVETTCNRLGIIEEISSIVEVDSQIAIEAGKAYLELLEHARRLKLKAMGIEIDELTDEQRKYLDILDMALTLLKYVHEHGIDF